LRIAICTVREVGKVPRKGEMKYDLTGERFGRLTVVEKVVDEEDGLTKWRCICDCENECLCRSYDLTSGKVKSCGCKRGNIPLSERKPKPEPKEEYVSGKLLNGVHSLCFDCIRSAAPPSLQCIWDRSKAKILPEGAEYIDDIGRDNVKKVTYCPEFLSIRDKANKDLLAAERKKNTEMIKNETILKQASAGMSGNVFGSGEDW